MVIRDDCRTKTKIGCWINIQIRLYYHHYYYYKRNALALVDLLYRHHVHQGSELYPMAKGPLG